MNDKLSDLHYAVILSRKNSANAFSESYREAVEAEYKAVREYLRARDKDVFDESTSV